MTKFQVTVTLDVDTRADAVKVLQQSGLSYGPLRTPKSKTPKPFQPKPWKPGMEYVVSGVRYQVWSETFDSRPASPRAWAVPVTPRDDGAPLVILSPSRDGVDVRPVGMDGRTYWKPDVALAA